MTSTAHDGRAHGGTAPGDAGDGAPTPPIRPRFTPEEPCRNCGDETPGNYCPRCGQARRDVAVSVGAMVADVLEDQFVLNRALPRTLRALVLRPGHLTREYLKGRRVHYVAPFRLYLASSVVFFLLFSVFGLRALDRATEAPGAGGDPIPSSADSVPEGASSQGDATAGVPTGREIQPWAETLEISFGSEETDQRVRRRTLDRFGHLSPGQALRAFLVEYLRYAPQMVFVLLPLFALILKVLYVRSGRFYAEHFVFSLHVHAFAFAAATVGIAFGWTVFGLVLGPALAAYLWMALRTVYGQGAVLTTLKTVLLGVVYGSAFLMGLSVTMAVTLLRL